MPDIVNNAALGMYVAAAVALVVMAGFFIYLWRIDRSVRELDRTLHQEMREEHSVDAPRQVLRPTPIIKESHDGVDRR